MRIIELLESTEYKDLGFVKDIGDEGDREIDFDLVEDLLFFMNNNDDAYRNHLHPALSKCINQQKDKKKTKSSIFKNAILDSYEMYTKEYPIRELPSSLDEKICKEMCDKLHEEVCQHIADGKYDERKGSTKR
jgi:hypothetical protein